MSILIFTSETFNKDFDNAVKDSKKNSKLVFESRKLKAIPMSYFKKEQITLLTVITLKNNRIELLDLEFFVDLVNLEELNLESNQIQSLPKDIFKNLKKLKLLFFNENLITKLEHNVFEGLIYLEQIHLSSNKIEHLDKNIFNGLSNLKQLYMRKNKIRNLNESIFKQLENLETIDFGENLIDELNENIFDSNWKIIKISFPKNRIKSLSNKLFLGLLLLQNIDFSFNLIETLPLDLFSIPNPLVIEFSNNRINFFDINELPISLWIIDFTQNFSINDFNITFESCFSFKDKNFWFVDEKQKEKYFLYIQNYLEFESTRNIWILTEDIKSKYNEVMNFNDDSIFKKVENYKINLRANIDNIYYLTKNTDLKQLKRRLYSIFLNKTKTNSDTFFFKNKNSLKNGSNSLNIEERLERLDNLTWSLLDFFIFLPKYVFSNQNLFNFHRYITQRLEENLLVVNLDYTFLTTEIIEALFERDDEYLIDLFLPKQSLQDFISNKQNDDGKSLKKIYKYINAERLRNFFSNINYSKCIEIAIEKDNEVMAIYLLMLLKFTFKNENITTRNLKEYSKISEFNENFLNEYLIQIFEKEWYIFVGLLLDYSIDKKTENFEFINFIHKNNTQNINVPDNQVSPEQNLINLPREKCKNILTLIKLTKQNDFLRHPTTKKILHEKWKYLPTYLYHANLTIFLLFVLFYSINIELYNKREEDKMLTEVSTYLSVVLSLYFILLELIEVIDSLISKKIFVYLTSIKNVIELLNFPLCLTTLFLSTDEKYFYSAKSVLFSITILFTYIILLTSLDKVAKIGPYVNVFGNIIRRSLRLIFIILICLIGFLLSFRNRSIIFEYNHFEANQKNNTLAMKQFEGSLILGFFKLLIMFTGGLMTEEMGLEEINNETFINHFLYIFFIFMMVILFLNVFTGISIDAVSELIKNSVADGVSNKIEYVDKIEEIMVNNNNKFLFLVRKFFLSFDTLIRKFFVRFDILVRKFYLYIESISNGDKNKKLRSRTADFFKECCKNFQNSKNIEKDEISIQINEKLDLLAKLIYEVKSDSNSLIEKVEIVSKRVNLIETNLELKMGHQLLD